MQETMEDFYAILEVVQTASDEEIKSAYRRLALQRHPDKNPAADAKEVFQTLGNAWETLKDPVRRAIYDKKYNLETLRKRSAGMNSGRPRGNAEAGQVNKEQPAHEKFKAGMRMPDQVREENLARERARYAAQADQVRREQAEQLARARAREAALRKQAANKEHEGRKAAAKETQEHSRAAQELEKKEKNWRRNLRAMPVRISSWMEETKKDHINRITQCYPIQISLLKSIQENEEKVDSYQSEIRLLAAQIEKTLWKLDGYRSSPFSFGLDRAANNSRESHVEHDNIYKDLQCRRAAVVQQLHGAQKKISEQEIELKQEKEKFDWIDQVARVSKAAEALRLLEKIMKDIPDKLDYLEKLKKFHSDWILIAGVSVDSSLHTSREKHILNQYTSWLESGTSELQLDFYTVIFRSFHD